MILIADAGATTTDLALIDGEQIQLSQISGFNPNSHDVDVLKKELITAFNADQSVVNKVYFYGAGLGTVSRQKWLSNQLKPVFPAAIIEVHSDILGACRAAFGRKKGVVGLLGTGTAFCHYDGNAISRRIPSLGYLLGDEGSGFDIGKRVLAAYLRKSFSLDLTKKFEAQYGILTEEFVLQQVYQNQSPNTWLAGFAHFAATHPEHREIQTLLIEAFTQMIRSFQLNQLIKKELALVGSIAFYFQHSIKPILEAKGIEINIILEQPLTALIKYHQKHG